MSTFSINNSIFVLFHLLSNDVDDEIKSLQFSVLYQVSGDSPSHVAQNSFQEKMVIHLFCNSLALWACFICSFLDSNLKGKMVKYSFNCFSATGTIEMQK